MRGSLNINYNPEILGTSVLIERNPLQSYEMDYRLYPDLNINNLYSLDIQNGDVIKVNCYLDNDVQVNSYADYNVIRIDYTNDDVNGDFGIKQTFITSGTTNTGGALSTTGVTINFTGTTNPNAYSFKYQVSLDIYNGCWNMGDPSGANCGYRGIGYEGVVRDVKYYNDKVYVCGRFDLYSGNTIQTGVTVNNLNGTLFSGFTNLGATDIFGPAQIEPYRDGSGKILLACSTYNNQNQFGLVRLNSNGTVDSSWSGKTTADATVFDVEILSDGKILCCGVINSVNSVSRQGICKLNSNGSLDTSFGGVSGFTRLNPGPAELFDMDVQSDGKILCRGDFNAYSGTPIVNVARLNSNGTLDTTFSSPLQYYISGYGAVKQLPDGKILVSGTLKYNDRYYYMLRLNSNGSIDTTFNLPYSSNTPLGFVPDFEVLSDGKIIVIFSFIPGLTNPSWIGRINSDGSEDTSFNKCYTSSTNLITQETIAVDEERRIIYAGGGWSAAQNTPGGFPVGVAYRAFLRLDWDGTISVCS